MITLTYSELNKAYSKVVEAYKLGLLLPNTIAEVSVSEIADDASREYLTPQTLEFRFYNFIPKGKWILETEVSIIEETEELA